MTDATIPGEVPAAAGPQPTPKAARRHHLFLLSGGSLVLAAAGWWTWSTFLAADTEGTENAFTNVEISQVALGVGGPVARVLVVNSQPVQASDLLVELDDTDLRLADNQAEAALGRARRQVHQVRENDATLAGQEAAREADEATARADLARAQADLDKARLDERRRQQLAEPGAASGCRGAGRIGVSLSQTLGIHSIAGCT